MSNICIPIRTQKGIGIGALRNIRRGEIVWNEVPFLRLSQPVDHRSIAFQLQSKTQEEIERYQLFFNLYAPNASHLQTFLDNALPCGTNPQTGVNLAGLFLDASRFNSSCRPNIHHHWNEELGVMFFRAMRPIVAGEELCISYDIEGLFTGRDTRMRRLFDRAKFWCICEVCNAPSGNSDQTREFLGRFIRQDPDTNDPHGGIQRLNMALQCLQQEGLVHFQDTFYFDGFTMCAVAQDVVNARLWLHRALESAKNVIGDDDPRVLQMHQLIEDPTTFQWWGFGNPAILQPPAI